MATLRLALLTFVIFVSLNTFFQKFRFCGDGDCPDWVLAEIHSNLSMLSSIKLKLLTLMVAKSIYGEDIKVFLQFKQNIIIT